MKRTLKTALPLMALTLVALLVLLACAPKAAPAPASKEPIQLSMLGDMSGPYAAVVKTIIAGTEDGAKLINERGGVNGHVIELQLLDTGGDVKKALSLYSTMATMEKKPPMYFGLSSTQDMALKERNAEDEIANITFGASTPALYPPGWAFTVYPSYVNLFGGFTEWMLEDWKKTATHEGPPRLAYLAWDIAFGHAPDTEETQAYLASKGIEVVAREWTPVAPTSLTESLMRIRDAEADWVVGYTHPGYNNMAFKDAVTLGVIPPNTRYAGVFSSLEPMIYDLCPDAIKVLEPIAISCFPSWSQKDDPLIKASGEMFTRNNRPESDRTTSYLSGIRGIAIATTILEKAVDDVGYDELSGAAFYAAAQKVKNLDVDKKAIGVPGYIVTYGPTKRCCDKMIIQQVRADGNILPVSDWFNALDLMPGGKDVP